MKKLLVCVLAVGFAAAAADAATLRMQFPDGTNAATVTSTTPAFDVQVYIDLIAGDRLTGFGAQNSAIAGNPILQTGFTPGSSGVQGPTNDALLGLSDYSVAYEGALMLSGPGTFLLGVQHLTWVGAFDGSTAPMAFQQPAALSVIDDIGSFYTFDARYNTTSPGYVAFGDWGNPGWGDKVAKGHQPTPNPLFITAIIPEPGSLVLLALGGFAAIRRR